MGASPVKAAAIQNLRSKAFVDAKIFDSETLTIYQKPMTKLKAVFFRELQLRLAFQEWQEAVNEKDKAVALHSLLIEARSFYYALETYESQTKPQKYGLREALLHHGSPHIKQ